MTLSKYHQQFSDLSDEEIKKRARAKKRELKIIFREVKLNTENHTLRVAVLGCEDKRFIAHYKRIFEQLLMKNIDISTFDITIEHLAGEHNVFQHDYILPLPSPPYDIIYSRVLLKFIETEKQFNLIKNSFSALITGGLAIHYFATEEVKAKGPRLDNGYWAVPLNRWEEELTKRETKYREINLKYGSALVLIRE